LYANQKTVDEMKQDLSKSFQKKYHCDEAHFEDYVNKYIKHWSEIEGKTNSLVKKQVQFEIGQILLRPVFDKFINFERSTIAAVQRSMCPV
jgi:hypothetical protein